jgi:hypothetical protein
VCEDGGRRDRGGKDIEEIEECVMMEGGKTESKEVRI